MKEKTPYGGNLYVYKQMNTFVSKYQLGPSCYTYDSVCASVCEWPRAAEITQHGSSLAFSAMFFFFFLLFTYPPQQLQLPLPSNQTTTTGRTCSERQHQKTTTPKEICLLYFTAEAYRSHTVRHGAQHTV